MTHPPEQSPFESGAAIQPAWTLAQRKFASEICMQDAAPLVGLKPQILRNKLNPRQEQHYLRVEELIALTRETGNTTLVEGVMLELGLVAVRMPRAERRGDLLDSTLTIQAAAGELAAEAIYLRQGGRVTDRVRGRVAQLTSSLQAEAARVLVQLESVCGTVPLITSGMDLLAAGAGAVAGI
ncbi:phage regulatory CII family protein [Zobellella sp. DQSA1]|uniref:phage regulatory CII family protein n=1 Tax=Zobellella sp. DQSA1 TaxID=3342386 RepID=UPI0035BF1188